MNDLVEIVNSEDLKKNPGEIAQTICDLAAEIESCKANLADIKKRNVWQRITSNNTRDLADAMIKQNDTISTFLNIVQSLIFLNLSNSVFLNAIMEKLNLSEGDRKVSGNKYIAMAKEYLQESITAARNTNAKFDTLLSGLEITKNELIEKARIDENQDRLLESLKNNLDENHSVDIEQEKSIAALREQLLRKENTDEYQTSMIREFQNFVVSQGSVNQNQSENIGKLMELHSLLDKKVSAIHEKMVSKTDADSSRPIPYLSIFAIAISVVALILSLLKHS